jgi:septal ring factor EnvC (AmiA/AmiB activator)
MRLSLVYIALLAASSAFGQTCKYVDREGRVIYSNIPIKNAKKVTCFEPPRAPAAAPPASGAEGETAAAAPPRPRVDDGTQRARDDERRRILESELAAEEEKLNEARQALAEQEAVRYGDERNYAHVLERLKPYQDAVAQHEKNIAALRQELANLR